MSLLQASLPLCIFGALSEVFSLPDILKAHVYRLDYTNASIKAVSE